MSSTPLTPRSTARRSVPLGAPRRALTDSDRHARVGAENGNAKVTEETVRAWRAEAARILRARLRATGGLNARTAPARRSRIRSAGPVSSPGSHAPRGPR